MSERRSLTQTIRQLNGTRNGAYRVTVNAVAEFNEVQVRLYESTMANPIAVAYIDRGHTIESRQACADEVLGTVNIYLRRV
jgi:hypothetical protein